MTLPRLLFKFLVNNTYLLFVAALMHIVEAAVLTGLSVL